MSVVDSEVRVLTDQQAQRRDEILRLAKVRADVLADLRFRRRHRRPLVLRRMGWVR